MKKLIVFIFCGVSLSACMTTTPADMSTCRAIGDFGADRGYGSYTRFHEGIDIATELFTPVIAAAPGTLREVVFDDTEKSLGNCGAYVSISHGSMYSLYCHLERIPKNLKPGDDVKRGQLIGHVGLSGLTRQPHVHFEIKNWANAHQNPHSMWHVEEPVAEGAVFKVPFFDPNKSYPDDSKITMPVSEEGCQTHWTILDHPTKPWRGR